MKAVTLAEKGGSLSAKVSEVATPRAGRGELVVEMKACGLCGTDIEKMKGEYTASMPVLGHEAVGTVREVGEGVFGFSVGDRVFPHHHVPCGVCHYCKGGSATMCSHYRGSNLDPGGFAEAFRVPKWNVEHGGVLKLPPDLDFETASLIEPVACCLRAIERAKVERGEVVLVVGAGPVGMMHAMLLMSSGNRVMITDVSSSRVRFAEDAGVGVSIDASKSDPVDAVSRATEGRGADVVMVATGNPRAILQGLKAVRKGGRVCLFGIPAVGTKLDYDIGDVYNSEINLLTSYGATESETEKALKAVASNRKEFERLITDRFPLSSFPKAVEAATSGESMKVILTP